MDYSPMSGRSGWTCVPRVAALAALIAWQGAADASAAAADDDLHAAIIGSLVHTRVDVDLHERPCSEALEMLGDAIGWTILDDWTNSAPPGSPQAPATVSIRARDISALLALEIMLAQAATTEAVTWQIGPGVIEVGTKARLSARGGDHVRMYDLTDQVQRAPYFQGRKLSGERQTPPDVEAFNRHPYRAAALIAGFMVAQDAGNGIRYFIRFKKEELLQALARGIVDLVEPGNWDFGHDLVNVLPGDPRYAPTDEKAAPARIARLRVSGESSVSISAPDYVHRILGGYPPPRLPAAEDPPADAARAEAADGIRRVRIDAERALIPRFGAASAATTASPHRRGNAARRPGDPLLSDLRTLDEARLRLAQALETTPLVIEFQSTPAREAFAEFSRLSSIPVIVRMVDHAGMEGIAPDAPISLKARSLSARVVLEAMVGQCSRGGRECTWQIRPGFVEVGSKVSLSVNAAREMRVYSVRDLMIDVPNFAAAPGGTDKRRPSEVAALETVETIVGVVEPQAWDWGQPLPAVEYEFGLDGVPMRRVGGHDAVLDAAAAGHTPASGVRRYVEHSRPAIIRYWGDVVIVHAPDYIHRQLAGYGAQPE